MYASGNKETWHDVMVEMAELTEFDECARDSAETKFYLPASTDSPNIDRLGNVIGELLESHGVVLIPDTYNK